MTDKDYNDFSKKNLESFREKLRVAQFFECACCQLTKKQGELAGAHVYKAKSPDLLKAMTDAKTKMPKHAAYALCLECVDSLPEDTIHTKVTAYFGKQGLFESV